MKNLSTAMTEIVKGNSARYYSKYVVDGKEHAETLNNFKFQNMINPNNEITIGNTCASSVTFSIYMPTVSLENKEITIFEGVKVGTEIKYIQLGIFTVTKQTSDGEYTSYEAYDRMYKADMPYFSDMTFPSTDKAVLNEICGKLGISLATNIVTAHTISDKPQGYTYRETIGYMAMLQGCNAVINSDGNLELRWYKDSGYVLDGHKYYQQGVTFTTSKDFIIQKLTCNNTKSGSTEQSQITAGDGATGLSFANPFMTQEILNEVYNKIGGFQFRPLTVKFLGDWRLEVGDIITVNKGGVDYKVPIMQITHECDGGLMDTVTSIGQSDTENSNIASGPITKQMERYYANLLVVNKALINKLDVDTAKITYATITNLTAVKGDVDYLKVNNLTVDKANLLYASIERMEVVEGQIRNLNVDDLKAQVANINTLMFGSASGGSLTTEFSNSIVANIGDAQIKSAMIESIAADKIMALDLNTTKFKVHSENGMSYWQDNTIIIKDTDRIRVQIGKDANSDYNMYVWDKSGNLMFDALGLTENGVKREIIRNDMIKENANIAASKLDIESLFNVINEDGSHTLKSSKIYVDANEQTLDVAFKNMTTNVTNLQNAVTTQGTQLTAVQGQISSKIWQQDITTAVNNLQIGGRNLLLNTADLTKWTVERGVTVAKDVDGFFKILTMRKAIWLSIYQTVTAVSAGQTYMLSGYNKKGTKAGYVVMRYYKSGTANVLLQQNVSPGRFTIKFTVPADADSEIKVFLGLQSTSSGDYTYFKLPKLELGDKATDWTPAPEDVDSSISSVESKVTTVSNQYTTLNQTVNSISGTVNSHTSQIATKADNSTVTTINNKVTSLTIDLSGFKTTVSDTYATKTALNTVDGKFANYSTTEQMNSAIIHKADSITSSVSATYTTKTEFNELQIGGRNLALNSGTEISSYDYNIVNYNLSMDLIAGEKYTATIWGTVADNKQYGAWFGDGYTPVGFFNDNGDGTFSLTFTMPYSVIGSGLRNRINIFHYPRSISGTGTITKFKLEKGNKATDWTPAPEEYATKESLAATNATLELKISKTDTSQIISMINASADEINMKANRFSLESTNATITKTGDVSFKSGIIGGWNINSSSLYTSAISDTGDTVKMELKQLSDGVSSTINSYITLYKNGSPTYRLYGDGGLFCDRLEIGKAPKMISLQTHGVLIYGTGFYYIGDYNETAFKISNSGEHTWFTNCELSLWGTQKIKYNLHVIGNIYGNVSSDSDRNIKKDIKALDINKSADFIYSLIPSEFRLKNGTSNRLHHGLIAQEVKESMGDDDWGVFIDKSVNNENYETVVYDSVSKTTKTQLTAKYGLRYDELIADVIATLQSQNKRIKELEQLNNC